jgi:ferredoxin
VQIEIDRARCLGNARCTAVAPHIFDNNDDDGSAFLLLEPDESMRHAVERAVQSCPTGAITLSD